MAIESSHTCPLPCSQCLRNLQLVPGETGPTGPSKYEAAVEKGLKRVLAAEAKAVDNIAADVRSGFGTTTTTTTMTTTTTTAASSADRRAATETTPRRPPTH